MKNTLTVIPRNDTPATRAISMMTLAKENAAEHVGTILRLSAELQAHLIDVVGDAYPAGVREDARRWVNELVTHHDRVAAIMERVR